MLDLEIRDDEGAIRVVPLTGDVVTVGRDPSNGVVLPEVNVSRRHARLRREGAGYIVEDLGSYNGVAVEGRRIVAPHPVGAGDWIRIGDFTLTVLERGSPRRAPPPDIAALRNALPVAHGNEDGLFEAEEGGEPPVAGLLPVAWAGLSPEVLRAIAEVPAEVRPMRLVFLAPAGAPSPLTLERLPVVLGSGRDADVVLPFASVAPRHARIAWQEGALRVESLGDASVTVDGVATRRAVLAVGSTLGLGEVLARVGRRSCGMVLVPVASAERLVPSRVGRGGSSPGALRRALPLIVLTTAVVALVAFSWITFVERSAGTVARSSSSPVPVAPVDAAAIEAAAAAPEESPAEKLARARALLDDIELEPAVALLRSLHARDDLQPALRIEASLLETRALAALGHEAEAVDACRAAVALAGWDAGVASEEAPRVQAACRAAAEALRRAVPPLR
jgi:hypothetical protein